MGFSPNFQRMRHGRLADGLRQLIYRWLVGAEEWPPTFKAPRNETLRGEPSQNAYVHLPFCQTICPHCPYNKARFHGPTASAYEEALLREIAAYARRSDARPLASLYFGGGTPTLTPDTIRHSIDAFRPLLSGSTEIAVEAHPGDVDPRLLHDLRDMGVNRVSLGVESLSPSLLRLLGRRYGPRSAVTAIRSAKAAGFDMLDVNLILSIPGQTVAEFIEGVAACLEAGADQISAYPLFTFEHTPSGRRQNAHRFANADDFRRLEMQRSVSRLCREAGFVRTSVWSYTKKGLSPYTTVTRPDYVGFGAGAGSKSNSLATFNTFSIPAYVESVPNATALVFELTERQQKADWLYWQVYNTRIDRAEYEQRFGTELDRDFGGTLRLLRLLGLAERREAMDVLTERGAIWVHRIQSMFSLRGIDAVWTACQDEPWPEAVAIA